MYTIKLNGTWAPDWVAAQLQRVIDGRRSRFTARVEAVSLKEIHVKPVRLREAKPYCGQHPGECDVGPRRSGRWLEWDDWVEFHNLINAELDRLGVDADAWTNPPEKMDQGRRMWVRRGLKARKRYDWQHTGYNEYGRQNIKIWNHGTPDQFEG